MVVKDKRPEYRKLDKDTQKREKRDISEAIVQKIKNYGGRFLQHNDDGRWSVMSDQDAIIKTSQALREKEKKKKPSRRKKTSANVSS